jgi:DNA polymerase I-like protein with 3'-5' exonuclease and polymerase domains
VARPKEPAQLRLKKPTPAMVAVAGTAWQGFLANLGVTVKRIDDARELADLARELADLARRGEMVALDFETTGDFVAGGIRPRLVQLFAGADEVAVGDLELVGFAPIACLADVGCVAYGASFEARVFMGHKLEPRLNDAALAAGLRLDRDAFQQDLATTWRRIKGKPTPTNKKAMQRSDFSGDLTPEQIAYAASDAVMAFQVWAACQTEARSRPYSVARDAIPAVASMEMAGLGYDHAAHVAIMGEWNRLAENEALRFNELTGLWPSEQKKFRERLQSSVDPNLIETWPRADKGGLSLSGKTLGHKPQAKLPEVAQYLRAKALGTLITTFGTKMAARVSPITRRLHFGFTLCGARTGRMTSSPNGQNLPAGPYRRIFRAPAGWRVVSLDYSAIELRAAALLAGEKSLLDVFKHPPRLPNGERNPKGDPHEALSAALQLDPVRNAGLRLAKALNFRLLFGTGVEGFAENANISIEEATELVDRWRRVRPSMVQWQNGTKAAAKRKKYATTPLGRRVNCYDVDPDTKNLRFKPNRALNVPIQGGCAEALMVALPLAYDGLRGSGLSAKLIAAVHDEIVFECAEADVEPAAAIVRQAMMTGLEKAFGARPRFQDIALYAVGAPKIGQTWDGDVFDLASLSEKETMVLLKGLADVEDKEDDEEDEGDECLEAADPEDDRDGLVEQVRATRRARLDGDQTQNAMRPSTAGQYGRMDHPRHPADLYETPPEAVEMLLEHVPLEGPVLEPSAGRGAIVTALRQRGLQVHASDLFDHGAEPTLAIRTGVDFLSITSMSGCRSIVMNPPFKDAESHVRHALQLLPDGGVLAVLLRMTWIAAKARDDLLKYCHTEIIAGRLKMLPPGAEDRGHGGTTDFAWLIMSRETVRATLRVRG